MRINQSGFRYLAALYKFRWMYAQWGKIIDRCAELSPPPIIIKRQP